MQRAWVLVCLLGLSCAPKPVPPECTVNADCGELALCEEGGTCRSVDCLSTSDCVFGTYCDDTNACSTGCGTDLDCLAGETCEDNACEAYGCRETQLDCPLGEFCDEDTCEPDDRGHCGRCDVTAPAGGGCPSNAECVYYSGGSCSGDNDCETGWRCDNLGAGRVCHLDTCIIECNPNAELTCPRGLACVRALSGDNRYFCAGDCPYLIEEGVF